MIPVSSSEEALSVSQTISPPCPVSDSLVIGCALSNKASPKLTLVFWVHGSVRFTSEVLREFM